MQNVSGGHKRLPHWAKRKAGTPGSVHRIREVMRQEGLHTVCEEARCPNIGECFSKPTATFMIMGDICTRNCGFCNVKHGVPPELNKSEPERIAAASRRLGLKHIVLTSVTRDDLADGGSGHFAATIKELRHTMPETTIEILTPDFQGDMRQAMPIINQPPDIFNHNVETVPRLYPAARPQADYRRSLHLLREFKERRPEVLTKSGIMLGLGETSEEVLQVITDIRSAGCDIITIGQYLRPTLKNLPVHEYIDEDAFAFYHASALDMGFLHAASGPMVRSSFNAEEISNKIHKERLN